MWRATGLCVAVAGLALAGCGSPANNGITAPARPSDVAVQQGGADGNDGSFLEATPTEIAFVRWTENNGALVGTLDDVKPDVSASTGTSTTELSFTGIHHDAQISITLSQGLGSYKTLTGSTSDGTLTLAIPQADGQLADAVLKSASTNDFNAAVANLASASQRQARANANAAAAAQQQAQADGAQRRLDDAVSSADSTFGRHLAGISDAVQSLAAEDLTFHDSLAEAASALDQARQDYKTEQRDAAASPPDCGAVGSDSGTVDSDEGSVESGQGSVQSATAAVSNEIDAVTNAVGSANQDLSNLQQAVAADPTARVEHSAADLGAQKKTVASQVAKAQQAVTSALRAAQRYVHSAKQVAASADALAGHCQ